PRPVTGPLGLDPALQRRRGRGFVLLCDADPAARWQPARAGARGPAYAARNPDERPLSAGAPPCRLPRAVSRCEPDAHGRGRRPRDHDPAVCAHERGPARPCGARARGGGRGLARIVGQQPVALALELLLRALVVVVAPDV